jgi:RNA polymerase sigma factor (sigma-70 family)
MEDGGSAESHCQSAHGAVSDPTSKPSSPGDPPPVSAFVTTHWTRVLEARGASPEAKSALSDLCAAYYEPVFGFIRRNAPDADAARDLTQEFFARQLAGHGLDNVDPAQGRFRSYLLGAVKHFLADMHRHAQRLKRGAGHAHESLDSQTDTSVGLQVADSNAPSPEREFDRKWALTLLARALASLADEHKSAGTLDQFEALKVWLTGDTENISQAETARKLGLNEGAVKVAVHRLRRQFRQKIKNEIAQTVKDPGQVDEEMKCLLAALL